MRAEPAGPSLEIRLLGPVEVTMGGRPIELRRQQQRAVLAILALDVNRVVSVDKLIDALWGEVPPPTAGVALYGLVSGLRKLLAPAGADGLVTRPPGYALELATEAIDLGRFERLAADGRRALAERDPERAATLLGDALALWRGTPLEDLAPLPFAQAEISRLEELRIGALEDRIEADLERGRSSEVVRELEPLVVEYPLRERLRGQLMRALYASGRQADALAAYRAGRELLVEELGLEPSEELQALERAILRHDPAVAPAVSGDATAVRTSRVLARRRWIAGAATALGGAIAAAVLLIAAGAGGHRPVAASANGVAVVRGGKIVAAGWSGTSPGDVAAGAASAWVTSADDQTVSRIDPDTGDVRQTIPVGSGASGVAADDRGVWVANSLDGELSRIDPAAGKVVDTIAVGSTPVAVALERGSVWVVNRDDQTLVRLDARTGAVTARIPVGAAPRAIAVGAGAVWVADELRGAVFRVDPEGRAVSDTINVGNGPSSIVVAFGAVWVANGLDGTVSRIDPQRDAVAATIPVGDGPGALAASAQGVWVSNEFGGTLALVDVRSNRVVHTVRIGERPAGIAAIGDKVVVAVRSAGAVHRGGTLRVTFAAPSPGPPTDTLTYGAAPTTLVTNDGLVGFRRVGGADSNQLVPDLAVAIPTPSDGGRTYTFRLRDGIRYSTGRLLQPADFRRALERAFIVLGETLYYGAVVGADTCVAKPARCDLSDGIVTDDRARTVTFHLREPDPDFLYKLALPFAFAVPSDTPARPVVTHPLPATGPYMIANLRPLTLVRNPRFREWSKAAQPDGYPDRLELNVISSSRKAVRGAEHGGTDVAWVRIPPALQREVRTQYASQLHENPVAGVTYLFLNTRARPFDDVRVRRAVNYAADRASGVRASTRGAGGAPTCQILPPDFPGFRRYCPYTTAATASGLWRSPDLARARRLVAASGTRGALVTVWVPDNHRGEGPFAAALFRKLGYRVRLERVGISFYSDLAAGRVHPKYAQAGLFTWFADYPAASNYMDVLLSCRAHLNLARFCNGRIDARVRRALELQTSDPYLANRLWARIDRAVVDQAPLVPLFTLKTVDFVSRRVGNYQYSLQWGVLLDQLWVR